MTLTQDERINHLLSRVEYLISHLIDEADTEPLSLRQARKLAKVGMNTIHAAVHSGELPARQCGSTNLGKDRWVILRGDLERWVALRAENQDVGG